MARLARASIRDYEKVARDAWSSGELNPLSALFFAAMNSVPSVNVEDPSGDRLQLILRKEPLREEAVEIWPPDALELI